MPDADANRVDYPVAVGGTRRPYPQARIVGLCEIGTHAVIDASIGSIRTGERELASSLTGSLARNMLVLADRGFFSFNLWVQYRLTHADLAWRLTKTLPLPVLEVHTDGSYRSEITKPGIGKARIDADKVDNLRLATHIPVRVVEYQIHLEDPDRAPDTYRIVTSILDPDDTTAADLAACYAQRWELETAFREIECQLLQPGTTLRSKHQNSPGKKSGDYSSPITPSEPS